MESNETNLASAVGEFFFFVLFFFNLQHWYHFNYFNDKNLTMKQKWTTVISLSCNGPLSYSESLQS